MTAIWPVFIPSKGRPACPTARLLRDAGVKHTIVVEPQDVEEYWAQSPASQVISLKEDDRGLSYARNAVKEMGRSDWYWQLDDDITAFATSNGKKNTESTADVVLAAAQALFGDSEVVAQGALEYQQYSWGAKKSLHVGGYCDVAVAIHAGRTRALRYRGNKEDRDFTLQVLASGYHTVRCSRLSFAAPKNGSNVGGLQEIFYKQPGLEEQTVDGMIAIWGPDIIKKQVKPDGRVDCKINWGFFKKARP